MCVSFCMSVCVSTGRELYPPASVQSGDEGVKRKIHGVWRPVNLDKL